MATEIPGAEGADSFHCPVPALLAQVKGNGSQAKDFSPCLWTQDSDIKSYSESAEKNTNSCPSRVGLC